MSILRIKSFLIVAIISAFPMLSQSGEADILQLISACKKTDTITAPTKVTDVLEFVESTVHGIEEQNKATPSIKKIVHTTDVINQLTAIANAYSSHNYYTSGSWVMDKETVFPEATAPPISGIPFQCRVKRITSSFGYRQEYERNHYGIDIAMAVGDTVRVSMDGIVSQVGFDRFGYGLYMIISHADGLETRYAHLSQCLAQTGEEVSIGSPIALSGNTGRSTGPHLHFETRYNGIPVNPILVFDINPDTTK